MVVSPDREYGPSSCPPCALRPTPYARSIINYLYATGLVWDELYNGPIFTLIFINYSQSLIIFRMTLAFSAFSAFAASGSRRRISRPDRVSPEKLTNAFQGESAVVRRTQTSGHASPCEPCYRTRMPYIKMGATSSCSFHQIFSKIQGGSLPACKTPSPSPIHKTLAPLSAPTTPTSPTTRITLIPYVYCYGHPCFLFSLAD